MTAVLLGRFNLDHAVQHRPRSFDVLAAGTAPARPNEVLASRRFGQLVRTLQSRYDYVLLDAPPVLPVADALTISRHVHAAILVCRSGRTSRDSLRSAVAALGAVSVPLVGTILSHAPAQPELKAPRLAPSRLARPAPEAPVEPGDAPTVELDVPASRGPGGGEESAPSRPRPPSAPSPSPKESRPAMAMSLRTNGSKATEKSRDE